MLSVGDGGGGKDECDRGVIEIKISDDGDEGMLVVAPFEL
jgi:hypothetical protein